MRKVLLTLLNISIAVFVFAQTAEYQYNRGSYLAANESYDEVIKSRLGKRKNEIAETV